MKNLIVVLLISLLYIIFAYAHQILLGIDDLLISNLAEQLTSEQIKKNVIIQEKWQWISYAIIPLIILLKTSVIAAILDLGCFLFGKEIKYKKLFNIVIKAEFIFLLVIIAKTGWFYFFQTDYTLEDLQYFYPLSALSIVGHEGLQPWFVYPFQVLNLFELAYWVILAYLIGKELKSTTDKSLAIVASSYGVSLLIWVVGVMFLTLNMS